MVNEDDYILDIVMAPQNQDGVEKSIDDYSIFKDVKKSGTPYLDNNIPRTAKKNTEYENPSLDIQKIRHEYKCKIRDWKWASRWKNNILQNIIKDDCLDSEWAAMNIKKGDIGNIYKSHIAVPITFMDHAIKHKLDKRLADVLQLKNEGRSILGFICVDHPMTYYFEDKEADSYDNIDINVMYLFADMISLIFIISLMYKEGSDTYVTYKAI
ncbi:hypothetical protein SAMN02745124_04202 [Desulfofustis glycolicus DSM 9705]|uniref:Uncharacterized protein n=2 Tax=Desulfofustis glycolicus TaxID=51195 RepID=A0A1M5YM58_9BACT|nr:hypothetical protein SAMN02745124_04202 [Desulfofustis glycolicus DSM 9705]